VHTVADGSKFIDHKILIVAVFFKAGVGQGSPNWLRTLAGLSLSPPRPPCYQSPDSSPVPLLFRSLLLVPFPAPLWLRYPGGGEERRGQGGEEEEEEEAELPSPSRLRAHPSGGCN
jgi:hypothetical protein